MMLVDPPDAGGVGETPCVNIFVAATDAAGGGPDGLLVGSFCSDWWAGRSIVVSSSAVAIAAIGGRGGRNCLPRGGGLMDTASVGISASAW